MNPSSARFVPSAPPSPSRSVASPERPSVPGVTPSPEDGEQEIASPRTTSQTLLLESGLETAFRRGELEVYYQPILTLDEHVAVGLEALVRWNHPQRGLLPAAAFLPSAQPPGLLPALDLWVLEQACGLATASSELPASSPPAIHVNFLPARLQDPQVVHRVAAALERTGLEPDRLVIEISEKSIRSEPFPNNRLQDLRSLGVRIALDDFGTARSPIDRLLGLDVQQVKIDRIFVDGLARDPGEGDLIAPLIALARSLGLQVLAEGIEYEEQAEILLELGCRMGQGYLFSRPLSRGNLGTWLGLLADGVGQA